MSQDSRPLDTEQLLRVLGEQLRQARKRHGWYRHDVQAQLVPEVSLQTLATWEQGTRGLSVVRLVEVCDALGESAPAVLEQSLQLVRGDQSKELIVDLRAVVAPTQQTPELAPLRRWAKVRVNANEGRVTLVSLSGPALALLAELCHMNTAELVTALRALEQ